MRKIIFSAIVSCISLFGFAIAKVKTKDINSIVQEQQKNIINENFTANHLGDGNTYFVSPTGEVSNPGTLESPTYLSAIFHKVSAGDKIYMLEGTYNFDFKISVNETNSGTPDNYITIMPYTSRVTINFEKQKHNTSNRGIQLDANFWNFIGIDICNAGDNGMLVTGDYNIIENCRFYNNKDTGLQISRYAGAYNEPYDIRWPSYNQILNCSSFNNADPKGEDADGFACKLTIGPGNVFDGCLSYNNIDDGWDLFSKDIRRTDGSGSGKIYPVTIRNCVAFNNGFTIVKNNDVNVAYSTSSSDGNGFKLGGDDVKVDHIVTNCIAFNNIAHGFTDNSNPGKISLINCTSFDNGIGNVLGFDVYMRQYVIDETSGAIIYTYGPTQLTTFTGKNNFDLARHSEGDLSRFGDPIYSNNSFNGCLSLNTRTKNTDLYRGTAKYSLFSGSSSYYYFDNNANHCDSSLNVYTGLEAKYTDSTLFLSTAVPNVFDDSIRNNLHFNWRNSDGSVNLGDFLKVNSAGPAATLNINNTALGANLH